MGHKQQKIGLAFLGGIAVGWVASLLLPSDTKQKIKDETKKRTQQIKDFLNDPEEQAKIKAIFSNLSQETIDYYHKAKDQLAKKLAELKVSLDQIDREKYLEIVNQVIDEIKQDKRVATKELTRLKKYLEEDYTLFRKNMDKYDKTTPDKHL